MFVRRRCRPFAPHTHNHRQQQHQRRRRRRRWREEREGFPFTWLPASPTASHRWPCSHLLSPPHSFSAAILQSHAARPSCVACSGPDTTDRRRRCRVSHIIHAICFIGDFYKGQKLRLVNIFKKTLCPLLNILSESHSHIHTCLPFFRRLTHFMDAGLRKACVTGCYSPRRRRRCRVDNINSISKRQYPVNMIRYLEEQGHFMKTNSLKQARAELLVENARSRKRASRNSSY